ncbi:four helix bundle protein [Hymenobacter weizhouensis]|uniref:four helix bundle protein n=1 Tax=Hymenobacter sp. YIM 151500-1 TaxID=2987689 RepID=UPI002227A985|nr:four helix bundle protein [Hymenobacter sp. YIM 151500-1]UYZ64278.1 four helix bundle protein [Hymenobacter sp. YIM 151500-1]
MDKVNKAAFTEALRSRTKQMALRTIRLFQRLPKTDEARIIGKQLLRSATSVGANYRAVCRARSKAEHYAKLCICVEETDETLYWLELLTEAGIFPEAKLATLHQDFSEVLAILTAARKTASAQ